MKALVLTAPWQSEIREVDPPQPGPGQVVVNVARVGICGTDQEFFTGEMEYLRQGHTRFPLILGHEWCGTVQASGEGVEPSWLGRRVTGDTMLGCGVCRRCRTGRHYVCEARNEVGIRGKFAGALAEQLLIPASALVPLPDSVSDTAGAMVEPGGNAVRCVDAAQLQAGERLLVLGPGTIGLLVALFARARGIDVHLAGLTDASVGFARSLGFTNVKVSPTPSSRPIPASGELYDAVVDATFDAQAPQRAVDLVEPGRRVVYIGLAGVPSQIDTRQLVLKDITAVGILGASRGLAEAVAGYASGLVDPAPLVAATVSLAQAHDVLSGWRPAKCGPGPKLHIDPRS